MIVSMKKATVLVVSSRRDRELARLKRLGLLHPDIERRPGGNIDTLQSSHDAVQRALAEIPADLQVEQDPLPGVTDDIVSEALSGAAEIAEHAAARRTAAEQLEHFQRELARIAPWGEFDPADVAALREAGIDLRLYSMSAKDFRTAPPAGAIVISKGSKLVQFARVWIEGAGQEGETPEELGERSDVQAFTMPEHSPAQLRAFIEERTAAVERESAAIAALAGRVALLRSAASVIQDRIEHEYVRLGMEEAEPVSYITGFIPEASVDSLRTASSNNGWGLLIQDPAPDDVVPTKIENPRWIRTIKPVFDMLGVIPGYRERDISMWFLIFFTVFVGMIIGDAGYGSLLFLAAIFGIISSKRKSGRVGDAVVLLTVLSLGTLTWGAITGNWFGFEKIGETAPFSYVVIPALDSFDPRSTQAVQLVCFILAAMHLSIAHVWNFIREVRERPAIKAFAQLGWLAAVLGLYFLVVSLFLGQTMPQYALYMIAGGIVTVFLFSGQSPEKGFFGGIGRGLSNSFTIIFDGIGAFSDIISYIRLFAVGLASVAIAQAFNQMASSVASSPVGIVLAVVILLLGHTLNLVMGGLAVVVHGVRLNLLEFSGHLGMEWTGVEYRPFAESEEHT